MSLTAGVFLPSGARVVPEPCFVDTVEDIQNHVGGLFDVVTTTMGMNNDECVVVGYVNDEFLVNGSELNYLATCLFQREIHGDVVVVWGLDENNRYDGDKHDLPDEMMAFMFRDLLEVTAGLYNEAQNVRLLVAVGVDMGLVSAEDLKEVQDNLYHAVTIGDEDGIMVWEERLMEMLDLVQENATERDMALYLAKKVLSETDDRKEA